MGSRRFMIHVTGGILALAVVLAAVLILIRGTRADAGQGTDRQAAVRESKGKEKWQEGTITWQGRSYRYNSGIKSYLFLGIDRAGEIVEAEDGISGGQSDAMFLLVTDSACRTVSIVAINRNTMTEVLVYGRDGEYVDTRQLQICLQHAYGDGLALSCQRTVTTVENLLYHIPIAGYLSLNMEGIPLLNDALGGVTVEVLEDLENPALGVSLRKGETVTLKGNEAYVYLRSRDMDVFDSSGQRLQRQQQYLVQLLSKLADTAEDEVSALKVYDEVEDYLVSNIDILRLAGELSEYEFDSSRMYSLPGETVMGRRLEEYQVDQEALYELILKIFYEPVEEAGE